MPASLPLQPSLEPGVETQVFAQLVDQLVAAQARRRAVPQAEVGAALDAALAQTGALAAPRRAVLEAALRVVGDLARQGWALSSSDGALAVEPPDRLGEVMEEKARVREQLHMGRDKQLGLASTRRFLRQMEQQRLHRDEWVSVFSLMRDGRDLAARLAPVAALPEADRAAALGAVVQPYLQPVERGGRCAHTGLLLQDIWRYFRHTWSNAYRTTPGRNLNLLVRDAAAPNHPVIGVAALISAASQIRIRDEWIGWSPESVLEAVQAEPTDELAAWLLALCAQGREELAVDDLLEDGILSRAELDAPTAATLERLRAHAADQRALHKAADDAPDGSPDSASTADGLGEAGELLLLEWLQRMAAEDVEGAEEIEEFAALAGLSPGHPRGVLDPADPEADWRAESQTPLFRSKRAARLADLLEHGAVLQEHLNPPTADRLAALVATAAGRRALRYLARRAKADRMGVAIADIGVCGSVAPYNHLLGGKLVSMLMASPEVGAFYRARYGGLPSIIASSMAGRPIRRGTDLVLLMTTSLYGAGSSQYNRVRVPCDRVGGAPRERITYERRGLTEGFGTSQFSDRTVESLSRALELLPGSQRVHSRFGEGASPRLRKVREGLTAVGLPANDLLRHGSPKVVYSIRLVDNLRRFLLGLDASPAYRLDQEDPAGGTEAIAGWWTERWLSKRVARPEILARVAGETLVYPVQHGARVVDLAGVAAAEADEDDQQIDLFG